VAVDLAWERTGGGTAAARPLARDRQAFERLHTQRRPLYEALADVIVLEAIILAYMATAKEVDGTAAACFVPYGAWVAFATLLNAEIVVRNPNAERMLPGPAPFY